MYIDEVYFLLDQKTKRCKSIQVRKISITIQNRNPESQPFVNSYYKIYLWFIIYIYIYKLKTCLSVEDCPGK